MRIYTRAGDDGTTQLLGPRRVSKDDQRVAAYGTVDELNATLGLALAQALDDDLRDELRQLQDDLFTVGSELSTVPGHESPALPRVPVAWITRLEAWIDRHETSLPPLRAFILPGGTHGAATLHLARAVCRRAERETVHLARHEPVSQEILGYLNRLSDYLFVLSRIANHRAGVTDVPWQAPSRARNEA